MIFQKSHNCLKNILITLNDCILLIQDRYRVHLSGTYFNMYFKEALLIIMIRLLMDCPIWPGKLHIQAGTAFVRYFGRTHSALASLIMGH